MEQLNDAAVTVSIVTICYNAADVIEKTLESVLAQDYSDYEYIIQDGASTDSTMDIVRSYEKRFKDKGIKITVNSGRDGGIYDAMNKAASCAEGTWVNFMNAGDCFYSSTVLSEIFSKNYPAEAILFGDCVEYEFGRFYLFEKRPEMIEDVMPFSHQSVFANRKLLLRFPFKCEYRYSADYDFLLTVHERDMHFCDTGVRICITTKDGLSSVNYHDMLMESAAIRQSHNMLSQSPEEMAATEKSLVRKQFVLDHFPKCIKKVIRIIQTTLRHQNCKVTIPPWYKMPD